MKEMKKIVLAVVVLITLMGNSIFAADALVWGFLTDIGDNGIDGVVSAVSAGHQGSDFGIGSYMIYLPAGSYTLTTTSDGYVTETVELVVEDNKTYQVDFELQPE